MSKKTAKAKQPDAATYELEAIVHAKLRGYPQWPAQVVDPDKTPGHVVKQRPSSKAVKNYCVRFFPRGDYAWLGSKELSPLQKHEIEAWIAEPPKKDTELLAGYKAALEPDKWREEKERELARDNEELAEAEVDELDEDGEGKSEKKNKKRKRDTEAKPKAKANGTEKKKKAKGESKATEGVESEDEDKPTKPASKKAKKSAESKKAAAAKSDEPADVKRVKEWRHRIQKHFLTNKTDHGAEMPEYDKLFTEVENFEGLGVVHLTESKIGKVMRHIAALTPDKVPRDDEFKFRERANALVDKWHKIIGDVKEDGGPVSAAPNGSA